MPDAETPGVPLPQKLRALTAGGAVVLLLSAVALFVSGQIDDTTDDLMELGAATIAAISCGLAAHGSRGRLRLSWAALASGCAAWAVGESIWSVYELGLHQETPFPSPADVGFLLFPLFATVALVIFPARASRSDRRRMTLDGLTTAIAIALVSWSTTLHAVYSAGGDSSLATAVGMAYPLSDIALLVVTVLVMSRARGHRTALALVASGLALMAVADSAFSFATAQDAYTTGDPLDLGWYAAFFLLAIAPVVRGSTNSSDHDVSESVAGDLLPYIPLTAAGGVEVFRYLTGHRPGVFEASLTAVLLALVLGRQALTGRDNKRLAEKLTEREGQLRHQAFHDGLTGLANRALYVDRVTHALDLHRRDDRPLSICFLDLDGFKTVNDTLGHAAGDELLVQVAQRFASVLSSADTLARFGGDEFAVLLEDSPDPLAVAEALLAVLAEPFALAGGPATVSVSIGVARVRRYDTTPSVDELLTRADLAMYAVKRRGKCGVLLHSAALVLEDGDDIGLTAQLSSALRCGEVGVVFQPIVELATGRTHTLEALARWSPEGRPVAPELFVPLAERAGLHHELFAMVLEEALSHLSDWSPQLRVAVNVSPSQLQPGLVAVVSGALVRHGIEGNRLVLELTESQGVADTVGARRVCEELRGLGVRLSIDDFGTGTSTLTRLRDLPIDEVKIDRSFVSCVDRDADSLRFVRAVLAFAEELGLIVIAEGVETLEERDTLARLGCHLAQGHLF